MDVRYSRGRWKFNRDADEPGFMDYRTMTLYPAPGYTVDLPNRESAACLRAFGAEVGAWKGGTGWMSCRLVTSFGQICTHFGSQRIKS